MAYELFCYSIQGAGHIKKGMPCEDYGMKYQDEDCAVMVLGDGHGDTNCPRSAFGSRTLCEIAVRELSTFAREVKTAGWTESLFRQRDGARMIRQLVTSIFGKWSCAVNEDYAQNPLTEEEIAGCGNYIDRYNRGERIEHIYGTTFIAGLLTSEYLLLLQQGDGRCVVFDSHGAASQPIPWDDRCFSNVCTSVCDTDAVQSCRYHIIDLSQNPVIACVAGSDGVEDSFSSMDKMHTFYREKLKIACEDGVEGLEAHLKEKLPQFSAEGSQDDVTICGLIDRQAYAAKAETFETENAVVILKDHIRMAQERIDSMKGKLEYLYKKCDEAENQCQTVRDKLKALENEYTSIKEDVEHAERKSGVTLFNKPLLSAISVKWLKRALNQVEKEFSPLNQELNDALAKKKACVEEYQEYKARYEGFLSLRDENQEKLQKLLDDLKPKPEPPAPEPPAPEPPVPEPSETDDEQKTEQKINQFTDPKSEDEVTQSEEQKPEDEITQPEEQKPEETIPQPMHTIRTVETVETIETIRTSDALGTIEIIEISETVTTTEKPASREPARESSNEEDPYRLPLFESERTDLNREPEKDPTSPEDWTGV